MTRTWPTWNGPAWAASPRTAHALGAALFVACVCLWAYALHVPDAPPPQAPVAAATAAGDPAAEAVAGWLRPGPLRLNVTVVGLMRRHDRAVAVLTVNGAPPKAFMTGERLLPDVRLVAIDADAVTIERAGATTRIVAPVLPDPGPPGIVRVR